MQESESKLNDKKSFHVHVEGKRSQMASKIAKHWQRHPIGRGDSADLFAIPSFGVHG